MSLEEIAILLEIVGICFEALGAAIFGERKIRNFLRHISSTCSSIREKILNILLPAKTEDKKFYIIGISVVTSLDFIVIYGLLQSIAWLWGSGIGLFILVSWFSLRNEEVRKEHISQREPRWLYWPVMLLKYTVTFIGAPVLLIPPILGYIIFQTMSFILNFLSGGVYIRWVFLGFGTAMILAGLILEYIIAA